MTHPSLSIATLVGSRICHDLISPVGAISNGIELISMGGPLDTPELSLISESVTNASSRIKFFRIAFGAAKGEQMMGTPEVAKIALDAFSSGRYRVEWQAAGDIPRPEVQAIYLAILCAESALPRGGRITITRDGGANRVVGQGDRVSCDPALWQPLSKAQVPQDLRPAHVQFALLPLALAGLGRPLTLKQSADAVELTF
jgi:histidine phosphotransferase ChpT